MIRLELFLSAAVGFATAAAFLYVGHRVRSRPLSGPSRGAGLAFALWWTSIGLFAFIHAGVMNLLGALEVDRIRVYAALVDFSYLLLLAANVGLSSYFLFLFSGARRALWIAVGYFLAVHLLVAYAFASALPVGIEIAPWSTRLVYDPAPEPGMLVLVKLLFGLPQVAGALGYMGVALKASGRPQRYRSLLVGASMLVWFLSLSVANLTMDPNLEFLARPLLGLAASLVVLLAYDPPLWVQRRLGVGRLPDEGHASAPR